MSLLVGFPLPLLPADGIPLGILLISIRRTCPNPIRRLILAAYLPPMSLESSFSCIRLRNQFLSPSKQIIIITRNHAIRGTHMFEISLKNDYAGIQLFCNWLSNFRVGDAQIECSYVSDWVISRIQTPLNSVLKICDSHNYFEWKSEYSMYTCILCQHPLTLFPHICLAACDIVMSFELAYTRAYSLFTRKINTVNT